MIIPEWLSSSDIETDRVFLLRSTKINRGPKIGRNGMYATETEYMSRRSSVIEVDNGIIWLIVGSTAYTEGFESTDPLETLRKFANNEFVSLIKVQFNGSIEDAVLWDGRMDLLRSMNTTPKVR